jgi:hypothetical protein
MSKRTIEIEITVNIEGSKYRVYDKSKYHEDWDLESVAVAEVNYLARKMSAALSPCYYEHSLVTTDKVEES